MSVRTKRQADIACSFCGKSRLDVGRLVAGPGVYICDECVDLCVQIIAGEHDKAAGPAQSSSSADSSGSAQATGSARDGQSARDGEPAESGETATPRLWDQIDTVEAALELLPKMAAAGAQVEANLTILVRRARALGATWAKIGEALGMTRQSAWERFSGEE